MYKRGKKRCIYILKQKEHNVSYFHNHTNISLFRGNHSTFIPLKLHSKNLVSIKLPHCRATVYLLTPLIFMVHIIPLTLVRQSSLANILSHPEFIKVNIIGIHWSN